MGPLLALGVALARRGPWAVFALAIAGVTTLALVILAAAFAGRPPESAVHDVPILASSALAWGGGIMLAIGASMGALRRDRAEGIRHLVVTRASERAYVATRVGGLATLIGLVVAGGTLVTGLVAILISARGQAVPRTLQGTLAAVVFSLAFAVVIAPIALATLGARSRGSGYLLLLLVLFVPELVAHAAAGMIPAEVTEVFSLPSALAALRSSLAPGGLDPLRFVRALVALTVFVAAASFALRRQVVTLTLEDDA